jgi:phage-related protein
MYEIIMFQKRNGDVPVKDFLDDVSDKMRSKITRIIRLLAEEGRNLGGPHSEYLNDGILELRVRFASDISRVLYFFIDGNRVILTHGFIKKTQKTPPEEIEKAKKYRREYLARREKK